MCRAGEGREERVSATWAGADLQAGLQVGHAGQLGRPEGALARDRVHLLRETQARALCPRPLTPCLAAGLRVRWATLRGPHASDEHCSFEVSGGCGRLEAAVRTQARAP